MAKNFRDIERKALADPRRRANIERERALLDRTTRRGTNTERSRPQNE